MTNKGNACCLRCSLVLAAQYTLNSCRCAREFAPLCRGRVWAGSAPAVLLQADATIGLVCSLDIKDGAVYLVRVIVVCQQLKHLVLV
eukprot:161106-Prorocentrum_minimum.AAC.4